MIILDLEWNRSYDKKPLDEILQIGAVRVDRLGGPVTDTLDRKSTRLNSSHMA